MKPFPTATGKIYTFPDGALVPDGVLNVAKEEGIRTAALQAIGGVDKLMLAYFNRSRKKYEEHVYEEFMEVISLLGNITLKEGKPFLHVHGTFGRKDLSVVGGHVMSARVSPLLEVIISPTTNKALRSFNKELGLNVIRRTT